MWAVVAFVGTVLYTPELGGFTRSMVERVAYIVGSFMMLVWPWWHPPCGVGSFAVLAYSDCII